MAEKSPTKPKRKKNYINNADMLDEVIKSKAKLTDNPDLMPAECITPKLAKMFMLLVERYAQKPNWSGYSYLDELKGEATVNLVNKWHKFNPEKSNTPFAYYSVLVDRSFKGQIKKEKNPQRIRDAIITSRGEMPSFAAQEEHERQLKENMDAKESWDKGQNDRFYTSAHNADKGRVISPNIEDYDGDNDALSQYDLDKDDE
ncbi:hypothetical protein CL653_03655 [bacterium]|nr:hypothetical protein [bacterium]|tara:strand:- start:313 stop:918 length:606 start_codon:yes stop_codon:yes gene_type:complete